MPYFIASGLQRGTLALITGTRQICGSVRSGR
jgi:hypothetical protein